MSGRIKNTLWVLGFGGFIAFMIGGAFFEYGGAGGFALLLIVAAIIWISNG